MMVSVIPQATYAQGKGKDKNNTGKELYENTQEKLTLMTTYGEGAWDKLPPGLSKRSMLPRGLDKLFKRGSFPNGLSKKFYHDYDPINKTPLKNLEQLTVHVEKIIYVDSTIVSPVYAFTEGTAYGNVTVGSNAALLKAINDAKVYLSKDVTYTDAQIKQAILNLQAALDTFKGNFVFGVAEKLILSDLLVLLKLVDSSPTRDALILKFENAIKTETVLTKSVFNGLVDDSSPFIEGLYDNLVLALKALTTSAKSDLTDNAYVSESVKITLTTAITNVEDYLNQDKKLYKYTELNAHYENLVQVRALYKQSAVDLLLAKVVVAKALLLNNSEVVGSVRTTLTALIETIEVDLIDTTNDTLAELKAYSDALNNAMTAFNAAI